MKRLIKNMFKDEKGQGMVEYILIVAIIVAVIIAVFAILKPQIDKAAGQATNTNIIMTNEIMITNEVQPVQ
jgi:Flp pilus assembly pilin Flp